MSQARIKPSQRPIAGRYVPNGPSLQTIRAIKLIETQAARLRQLGVGLWMGLSVLFGYFYIILFSWKKVCHINLSFPFQDVVNDLNVCSFRAVV